MSDLKSAITKRNLEKFKREDPHGYAIIELQKANQTFKNEIDLLISSAEESVASVLDDFIQKVGDLEQSFRDFLEKNKPENGRDGNDGKEGVGIMGPPGPQGPMGPMPVVGVDFRQPKDGENGQSVIGPQGPEGKPGSPDSPIQIAKKLNALEEKVDMSVIKGLKKSFDAIRSSIRESKKEGNKAGGGMGNVINQSFNVSSATTTITLSDRVAANGNALWAYYEGALIVKNTGFTIGSDRKTVTLLFVPEDGTHIDVLFVRG